MTKTEKKLLYKFDECFTSGLFVAWTAKKLAEHAGLNDGPTSPTVRRILAKATVEEGYPVCSGPDGFWIARSRMDLQEYALSLFTRAYKIQQHADAVRQVAESWSCV